MSRKEGGRRVVVKVGRMEEMVVKVGRREEMVVMVERMEEGGC